MNQALQGNLPGKMNPETLVIVGYPSIYGNATIMKWNQRS